MIKNKLLIFLAGPIENKSWKEANEWRDYIREKLEDLPIIVYNPLNKYRPQLENIEKINSNIIPISELDICNTFYLKNADVILCNLDGKSIGTYMEIGYGYALNKIIIAIDSYNYRTHSLVSKWVSLFYDRLDDAIEYIKNDLYEGI